MDATIDSLLISVEAPATEAQKSIEGLANTLGILKNATKGIGFLGLLQCLDREAFRTAGTHFFQTVLNFPNLLLDQLLLPFHGDGDFLKLRVTHDNGIIITGGDLCTEGLSPCRFKVLFSGNQDIGRGVQPQKLRGPLLRQMVGDSNQGLAAQAQPLGFHGGGNHFKGLAATNLMGKECIAAVKNVGDGVLLMLPEGYFRTHTAEGDMAAVILSGPGGVE